MATKRHIYHMSLKTCGLSNNTVSDKFDRLFQLIQIPLHCLMSKFQNLLNIICRIVVDVSTWPFCCTMDVNRV